MPAILALGMGALHHPIRTSNSECQKFFDQGLTLTYAFNFQRAIASFRRAAELDPRAAMPWWGVALALSPSYNSTHARPADERIAFDSIHKAKKLADASPPEEKDLIEALLQRSTDNSAVDRTQLARNYSRAMHDVYAKYPDDPDVSALYAESLMDLHPWHLWTVDGQPEDNTTEIEAVLESTLRRWPDHVGANHYFIHLMEASARPERAIESAKRLETLVPAAGHLLHMSGHIYFNCGDYSNAVRSALAAEAADRIFLDNPTNSDMAYIVGYGQHNLRFLTEAATMEGNFRAAQDAASRTRGRGPSCAFELGE